MIKDSELKNFIFKIQKKLNSISSLRIKNFKLKKSKTFDPVTNLDIKIEKYLRKMIKKNFPTHSIKGEELKDQPGQSDYTWIIDPIDGTKNLITGFPTWSNLLGLYLRNKPILSFANFPILNSFYYSLGKKSFKFKSGKKKIIKSNKKCIFSSAKIVLNTYRPLKNKNLFNHLKKTKQMFRVTGGDAYNFCLFAEGKIDVIIEAGLKLVDILPLVAIIKNSGGIITNWKGKEAFNDGKILVSPNLIVHNKFLKIINS